MGLTLPKRNFFFVIYPPRKNPEDQKLQELRESKKAGGGLQSLAEAQEAGEMMLELSQKIGTSENVERVGTTEGTPKHL